MNTFYISMMRLLTLLSFITMSNASYAGLFGPSNYDECIIDSMKGVTSDNAANSIRAACHGKFPKQNDKAKSDNTLTANEIALIEISDLQLGERFPSSGTTKLSGNVYNGNNNKTVHFITIEVSYKNNKKRLYNTPIGLYGVSPLTMRSFDVMIDYSSQVTGCRVVDANKY